MSASFSDDRKLSNQRSYSTPVQKIQKGPKLISIYTYIYGIPATQTKKYGFVNVNDILLKKKCWKTMHVVRGPPLQAGKSQADCHGE